MNRNFFIALGLLWLLVCICPAEVLSAEKILKMSTTTSTQASGLLDVLLPELVKDTGIKIKVIAKGTGAAIRDGMDGNVDVIFVHAKSREEKFVDLGYGDLVEKYGVKLVDLNEDEYELRESPEAVVLKRFEFPKTLKDSYLISVPVLKRHSICKVTLSLKNMIFLQIFNVF